MIGFQGSPQADDTDNQQRNLASFMSTFLTGDGLGAIMQAENLPSQTALVESGLGVPPSPTARGLVVNLGGYCDIYGLSHMPAVPMETLVGEGEDEDPLVTATSR